MTLDVTYDELIMLKDGINNEISDVIRLDKCGAISEEYAKCLVDELDVVNGKIKDLLRRNGGVAT